MRHWLLAITLCSPLSLSAQTLDCVAPGPRIAITFDDGPRGDRTHQILDILGAHGVQATFFLVGRQVPGQEELVHRMVEEGHEIGVHTWSHKDLAKSSASTREYEITHGLSAITKVVPHASIVWWRAPYGSRPELGTKVAHSLGLRSRLWEIDTLDWKGPEASVMVDRVLRQARDGVVVLMHDQGRHTIEALDPMLLGLREAGFQVVSVSRLSAPACPVEDSIPVYPEIILDPDEQPTRQEDEIVIF